MGRRRRIIISQPLVAACLLAAGGWAVAGQPGGGLDLFDPVPGQSSAESGKPMIGGWARTAPAPGSATPCAPPLPCGTRLLGAVRKDGAVELQVPALHW
jgi:hypothetical protein